MTKQELLNQVTEALAGSSPSTIQQFRSIIGKFYDHSNGVFTRSQVVSYIKKMEKQGYAAGTRAMHFRVLKRGFEIAKKFDLTIDWPFYKRAPAELPVSVAEWDVQAPSIPVAELKTIIDGAKDNKLPPDWAALVAVSSIYGLRRIEMVELMPEFLDLKARTLRIITAKHGRSREHLIPEEIEPYLASYPFGKYSEFKLSGVYHEIRLGVGLPVVYGTGFHCFRRTLDTALSYIFPEPVVEEFLRWKKSSMRMARRYWTPPEGSSEKIIFGLEPFPTFGGELVYGKHPFLSLWKKKV